MPKKNDGNGEMAKWIAEKMMEEMVGVKRQRFFERLEKGRHISINILPYMNEYFELTGNFNCVADCGDPDIFVTCTKNVLSCLQKKR